MSVLNSRRPNSPRLNSKSLFLSSGLLIKTAVTTSILLASMASYADFNHSTWDSLLNKNVTMTNGGKASVVNYNGMKADQSKLDSYMAATSKVSQSEFNGWSNDEQLAFLINVYNAGTVELVLTKYPTSSRLKILVEYLVRHGNRISSRY